MTIPKYPAAFACAQVLPYHIDVNMGVIRTPMESGHARQRRMFRTMPHLFTLEFVMKAVELGRWQSWVNEFAYDYFSLDLESMYSGLLGQITIPHDVRFTSNLTIDNVTYEWVRVRVQAELSPAFAASLGPKLPTHNWVIAGHPAPPPPTDWIIAGEPPTPSLDTYYAGSPQYPAAII